MLQPYRDQFNAQFSPAKYADLLARLNQATRTNVGEDRHLQRQLRRAEPCWNVQEEFHGAATSAVPTAG